MSYLLCKAKIITDDKILSIIIKQIPQSSSENDKCIFSLEKQSNEIHTCTFVLFRCSVSLIVHRMWMVITVTNKHKLRLAVCLIICTDRNHRKIWRKRQIFYSKMDLTKIFSFWQKFGKESVFFLWFLSVWMIAGLQ